VDEGELVNEGEISTVSTFIDIFTGEPMNKGAHTKPFWRARKIVYNMCETHVKHM